MGEGSHTSWLMEPIPGVPVFYSSVTNTFEVCVAIIESVIHIYIPIGDRDSARSLIAS